MNKNDYTHLTPKIQKNLSDEHEEGRFHPDRICTGREKRADLLQKITNHNHHFDYKSISRLRSNFNKNPNVS